MNTQELFDRLIAELEKAGVRHELDLHEGAVEHVRICDAMLDEFAVLINLYHLARANGHGMTLGKPWGTLSGEAYINIGFSEL